MNGSAIYEETSITTQNKGRIIVMLYDGAVRFLRRAVQAIRNQDYKSKSELISRAQDVIFELNTVLDMETGGEIARNLRNLYNFMWRRLGEANIRNNEDMVREIIGLLEELNSGWRAIAD